MSTIIFTPLLGEILQVIWAKFSTLSWAIFIMNTQARPPLELKTLHNFCPVSISLIPSTPTVYTKPYQQILDYGSSSVLVMITPGNPYWMVRLSTVDLLVKTCLDRLLLILQTLLNFFAKISYPYDMRRSSVLSLPLPLVFPDYTLTHTQTQTHIHKHTQTRTHTHTHNQTNKRNKKNRIVFVIFVSHTIRPIL